MSPGRSAGPGGRTCPVPCPVATSRAATHTQSAVVLALEREAGIIAPEGIPPRVLPPRRALAGQLVRVGAEPANRSRRAKDSVAVVRKRRTHRGEREQEQ